MSAAMPSSAGLRGRPSWRTSATAQVDPPTFTIYPGSGGGGGGGTMAGFKPTLSSVTIVISE